MKKNDYYAIVELKNMNEFMIHCNNIKKKYGLKGKQLTRNKTILKEIFDFPFKFGVED